MNSKFVLLRIPYCNVTSLHIYLQNLRRVCHNQYAQSFLYGLQLIYTDKKHKYMVFKLFSSHLFLSNFDRHIFLLNKALIWITFPRSFRRVCLWLYWWWNEHPSTCESDHRFRYTHQESKFIKYHHTWKINALYLVSLWTYFREMLTFYQYILNV